MKIHLLIILSQLLSCLIANGQMGERPTKPNLVQEFTGSVINSVQYDGDFYFTLKDSGNREFDFYFNAGTCYPDGDPGAIEAEMDDELYDLILDAASSSSRLIVRVTAKSSYGHFCLPCDDCEEEKVLIWRPMKVVRIK